LAPPAWPGLDTLSPKRFSSYASWRWRRRKIHRPDILTALVSDVRAHAPDHLVVTGDLTNMALHSEFERARAWLGRLAEPGGATVVPGNHDALVSVPWERALAMWSPWMEGDSRSGDSPGTSLFPAIRVRGCVAFVGLNSSRPTPLFSAAGTLGSRQIAAAEQALAALGRRGLFRVVLLHHPIVEGAVSPRKALSDRAGLCNALRRVGADLVLHGHTHRAHLGSVDGPHGPIAVLAVPSASACHRSKGDAARWHLISVRRTADTWRVTVTARILAKQGMRFEDAGSYELVVPATDKSYG
jgi:3',5'-cyclic AMP phosphodiesterase CpdA